MSALLAGNSLLGAAGRDVDVLQSLSFGTRAQFLYELRVGVNTMDSAFGAHGPRRRQGKEPVTAAKVYKGHCRLQPSHGQDTLRILPPSALSLRMHVEVSAAHFMTFAEPVALLSAGQ